MRKLITASTILASVFGCQTNEGIQESASKKAELGELYGCDQVQPEDNTFCGYQEAIPRCDETVSDEIQRLASTWNFVESVYLGRTHQAREIHAIRIGNLSNDPRQPSPQSIIVSAMHGNEVLTVEATMRLIRYFIESYNQGSGEIYELLQDRTLTIIPVANPDGYDKFALTGVGSRVNGNPCDQFWGVDLNRNYPFGWTPTVLGCTAGGYPGASPFSEPETKGIVGLIENEDPTPLVPMVGSYVTTAVANVHTSGHVVNVSPGVDVTGDVCSHEFGAGKHNCSSPNIGLFNKIFGSQRPTNSVFRAEDIFSGENERRPFQSGTRGRVFRYQANGTFSDTVQNGFLKSGRPILSGLVELTTRRINRDECRGVLPPVENAMTQEEINNVTFDLIEMAKRMLRASPDILTESYLVSVTNRYNSHHHIHRRSPETENPTLRTNVPKWLNKPYIENSTIGKVYLTRDITVPGSEHATWFWDRDDEYQFDFPNEFVVCADDAPNTDYCSVASFDIGVLDLCSANNWSTANWSFVGESTGSTPSEQCYWELDGNDDSLTRDPVSLEGMSDSRLIYSYRLSWLLDSKDTNLVVQVSDNGFNNCSHFEGTGCRIVMEYYNEEDARSQQVLFRTEELDVSDFDNKQNVQVRFVGKTGSSDTVQVYDVHFAGN